MESKTVAIAQITQHDLFSPNSLPKVDGDQQRYLLKGLQGTANTERAYRADLNHYTHWCQQQAIPALPTTSIQLGQYVSALAPHRKWATIAYRPSASGTSYMN